MSDFQPHFHGRPDDGVCVEEHTDPEARPTAVEPEAPERVERFDRSWWHYADDCPVPPVAVEPDGLPLDVPRLEAILESASLELEYVGPGDLEHEQVAERFIRYARLGPSEDKP